MSALEIYRLQPGQTLRFRVRGGAAADGFRLEVRRPNEGLSPELCLRLLDSIEQLRGSGRVPIADGYLAIARALRGWFQSAGVDVVDFELELLRAHDGAFAAHASDAPR